MKISKSWVWVFFALLFFCLVLSIMPAQYRDLGGDSCQYIIIGESLVDGRGLRMVNYPGEPLSVLAPLTSLLLVPVIYFFGRNFWLMQLLILVMSYFSCLVFYKLFSPYSRKAALAAVILLALNPMFIFYSTRILTEIPFLLFSGLSLLAISRYKDKSSWLNKEGFLVALALMLAYFTRYIGVLLFVVGALYLFFDNPDNSPKNVRLKKILFLGALFLPIVILWGLRNARIYNPYIASPVEQFLYSGFYRSHLGLISREPIFLFLRFGSGVVFYAYIVGRTVLPFLASFQSIAWWNIFSAVAVTLAITGMFTDARRGRYSLPLYFILYFVFICLWPFLEDGRYILPLLPFVFYYFLRGLERLCAVTAKKFCFPVLAAVLLISSIIPVAGVVRQQDRAIIPEAFVNFLDVHSWIKENLPRDDSLVISRKPTLTFFYSGHKSLCYLFDPDPDIIWKGLLADKARYILMDEFSAESVNYMGPLLIKYGGSLKLLYRKGNSALYEVVTGGS